MSSAEGPSPDESAAPAQPVAPDAPAADVGAHHAPAEPTAEAAGTPRHAVTRTYHRGWRIALAIVLALIIGVGGLATFYLDKLNSALGQISRQTYEPTASNRPTAVVVSGPQQPTTFLMLGSDSRTAAATGGNSDTLMLAYLPADRKHVYLISVPRDSFVMIYDSAGAALHKEKVNAAFAFGGVPAAVVTVEKLLDLRIDHEAVVDFDGFLGLTDALGGVDVYNKIASESNGFTYPAGIIHLQGPMALQYVRQRYDLPNADFDRTARQREVVKAILAKVMSAGVLANPITTSNVIDKVKDFVTVDSTLSNEGIRNFALSLKIGSTADIRTLQIPCASYGTDPTYGSIVNVDPVRLAELTKAFDGDNLDAYYALHKDDPVIGAATVPEPSASGSPAPSQLGASPTSSPSK